MIATLRRFGISLWQALDRHAEPIKILSGLIVGLFVLFEYLDRQKTTGSIAPWITCASTAARI